MNYTVHHSRNEAADRRKSAIITALISALLFLLIYYYKFTQTAPVEPEVVTTMLLNFGDNSNGNGAEEPANEEGSAAAAKEISFQEPTPEPKPETTPVVERSITGNNTKISAAKSVEKNTRVKTAPSKNTASTTKTATAAVKTSATKTQGDGRGTAAIGNLVKGRGTTPGSQGQNGTTGNAGDPLGGDGDGDSKIGIDRKLTGFIPGTMGRGGAQPNNSCSASGTVQISFTVDKAGNVISARRSGGISDHCVVSTSVAWVKQYVKAERANTNSTGSYKITF